MCYSLAPSMTCGKSLGDLGPALAGWWQREWGWGCGVCISTSLPSRKRPSILLIKAFAPSLLVFPVNLKLFSSLKGHSFQLFLEIHYTKWNLLKSVLWVCGYGSSDTGRRYSGRVNWLLQTGNHELKIKHLGSLAWLTTARLPLDFFYCVSGKNFKIPKFLFFFSTSLLPSSPFSFPLFSSPVPSTPLPSHLLSSLPPLSSSPPSLLSLSLSFLEKQSWSPKSLERIIYVSLSFFFLTVFEI